MKRQSEDDLATALMKGQLATLRMFVRFCVSIDAVEPKLDEKILLPTTTEEDARDEMLDPDRAQKILKNGKQRERLVGINDLVCRVLDDWLEVNQPAGVDEYGRKSLLATDHGRISHNRGRSIAYQYTRPCIYGEDCPHDRDTEKCDAPTTSYAYGCPSSLLPRDQ